MEKKKQKGMNSIETLLYFTRLEKAVFDEETQRLLMAEKERNPYLTIIDN